MPMHQSIQVLIENVEKVIIGKREVIIKVITSMLADGHILIEDVPGVGKTQLVSALSKSISGKFNRIQMTPDIMPSDISGYSMIHPETKQMIYRQGAAVCNIFLVDEINRASPKAQSSLLEIMEEHQISIEGKTFPLPSPFMVLATQNPIETYGTYHLPEAQMDRFLMRLAIGYPSKEEEIAILENSGGMNPLKKLTPVLKIEEITSMKKQVLEITVHPLVKEYIWHIVHATRNSEFVHLGASPRGALALQKAAKAFAFIQMRKFVTPDDVRTMAPYVLAHRIMLSPKGKSAFSNQEKVMQKILETIPVPTPQAK